MSRTTLFQPFTCKDVTARNHIVVSPMCQYASVNGSPTDWHLAHMGRYAVGGAGIVFYEETGVELRGRKTSACAAFHDDEQIPEFRRITDLVSGLGAIPAIQLGHSGARGSGPGPTDALAVDAEVMAETWEPISSSAVRVPPNPHTPREMTGNDIDEVIRAFAASAARSAEAGFEIVEIHGAHGYLIQQFLSPAVNRRTDGYGGNLLGRMRFAIEVVDAVREVWPEDKPLFFRVSAVDGKGGLWSFDETLELAQTLKSHGIDLIDCSSGGLSAGSPMPEVPRLPAYHVPYATEIREKTGLQVMAPGLITAADQAEELLTDGRVDLICMARELMWNADWPAHAARELGEDDALSLLPAAYRPRLRSRAEQALMPQNQPGARTPRSVSTVM